MLGALVEGLLDGGLEVVIEVLDHGVPLLLALGNQVEVLLDAGREVIVHDGGEVLHEEVVDDGAHVGGDELALV